jgi:hypothetical protein
MSKIDLVVTIREGHWATTDDVARQLTEQGMTVTASIPDIGIVFGRADEAALSALAQIGGVQSVEPETELGPYAPPS